MPSSLTPFATVTAIPVPLRSQKDDSIYNDRTILERPVHPLTDEQLQRLQEQGFTRGLALSLNTMKEVFAMRYWIVDNSGSMAKTDGHRILPTNNRSKVKTVPCSRWEEIVECVDYHIRLAALIDAPTKFRLLNNPGTLAGPQRFSVAYQQNDVITTQEDANEAIRIMHAARPGGCTPLTSHVLEIHREIFGMAPLLNHLGKKVVIVIATDGLPTDERGYSGHYQNQEFTEALRLLESLPVWVVVRLCTDEDEVVEYYNKLDEELELSLDLLDDFHAEALEVVGQNPWLNYSLPLHRLRETGYQDRVFDMMDERPLTKSEIRDFCGLLFGQEKNLDGLADPSLSWKEFHSDVTRLLQQESLQYDPIRGRALPWINLRKLNRIHRPRGCFPF